MLATDTQLKTARLVPAIFFGMVLGIGGLGTAWRAAHRVWGAPAFVGECLSLLAVAIWLLWSVLFAWKWLTARQAAMRELNEPTLSFIAILVPMSTIIASFGLKPYAPDVAWAMCAAGVAAQVAFTIWTSGTLWQGGRTSEMTTPVIYMPPVGGNLVSALGCGVFGYPDLAILFWGAGLISWLVWESIVLNRFLTSTLPVHQRATIGIHLTPPAVACMAYLGVTEGSSDKIAPMLFGYALLQGLIMLRLAPWLRQQPFTPSAWAYTFGVAAIAVSALWLVERGQTGPVAMMALPLFVGANIFIGWIAARTLVLAMTGTLVPQVQQ